MDQFLYKDQGTISVMLLRAVKPDVKF